MIWTQVYRLHWLLCRILTRLKIRVRFIGISSLYKVFGVQELIDNSY